MRHNQLITLYQTEVTPDAAGNQVETPVQPGLKVYANQFSVSSVQFWNAAMNGMRAEAIFDVYTFEYKGHPRLTAEQYGQTVWFRVIHAEAKGERTRLICERVAADG
jgi:head-tail adaptor